MKVSYRKIKTNIDWDEYGLLVLGKEELDAIHVWRVLWNAHLKKNPPVGAILGVESVGGLPF